MTRRENAVYVTAKELNAVRETYKDGNKQNSPIKAKMITGDANRVLLTGYCNRIDDVGNEGEYYQMRLVGPIGATGFVYVGSGENQPGNHDVLLDARKLHDRLHGGERLDPLLVIGKPRVYDPDDKDGVYSSVRAEVVNDISEDKMNALAEMIVERTKDDIGEPETDAEEALYNACAGFTESEEISRRPDESVDQPEDSEGNTTQTCIPDEADEAPPFPDATTFAKRHFEEGDVEWEDMLRAKVAFNDVEGDSPDELREQLIGREIPDALQS